jgi:hypothetical protein
VTETVFGKNDPTDKMFDVGMKYFSNFEFDVSTVTPLYIETNIEFKVGKYPFRGIIDFMYRDNNGDIIMIDHKTSEYPIGKNGSIKKSKSEMMKGYTRQLALYCYGVEQVTGKRPKYMGWNFIKGKPYKIPVTDEIIADAVGWATQTIKKIYETEEFNTTESYIMCSVLCDVRKQCWD